MNESITHTTNHFSPAASLAAIGVKLSQVDLFGPIRAQVQIRQKTVKHTPIDKLTDAFISLLAGAHGLVEINTLLRTDLGLQRAFGRQSCAEQSVVQETLDACSAENVVQLQQALDEISRSHSQGVQHDYQASFHLLDVDMSGMPCGPKAAFARILRATSHPSCDLLQATSTPAEPVCQATRSRFPSRKTARVTLARGGRVGRAHMRLITHVA